MPGRRKIEPARVLQLLAKGCTQTQVALRLGYPKSAVSMIASGKYTEVRAMTDFNPAIDIARRMADLPLFAARAPSVHGSVTSAAAADSLDGTTLNAMQRRVLAYLEEHGPATDEEIATGLGMNPSTQRPRRIELARRGLIVEDGTRRTASGRMACVWRVA